VHHRTAFFLHIRRCSCTEERSKQTGWKRRWEKDANGPKGLSEGVPRGATTCVATRLSDAISAFEGGARIAEDCVMPRILIVDDDKDYRECLQTYLEYEGYQAVVAGDGVEALHRLRRTALQLVLLDMMMPLMDGAQFLARQRNEPGMAGVPVLVISASDEAARQAHSMGAAGVLKKPLDFDQLVDAIRAHCAAEPAAAGPEIEALPAVIIYGLGKVEAADLKERLLGLLGGRPGVWQLTVRRDPADGGMHLALRGPEVDRTAVCYAEPGEDLIEAICGCLNQMAV
jgi:two-component system, chemotaxis family, chemotaxis protein CheY